MPEVNNSDFLKTLATLHLFASGMGGALNKKAQQLSNQTNEIESLVVKWRAEVNELLARDLSPEDRERMNSVSVKLDQLQERLDKAKECVKRAHAITDLT